MAIAGLRGTGDWGADERPKSFRELILWRDPNGSAPLFALSAKMGKQNTDDPEFSWWEEELMVPRFQVSATTQAVTADTTINLTGAVDAKLLVPGDLLLVEKTETTAYDNEFVLVSSVTNTSTIVVTRGAAGTTAATIPVGSYLTKISNVYAEGTGAPNASSRNPTKYTNYTQIFKTAYELTNTAVETRTRTGDPLKNDKKRKMFDHAAALEFQAIYGKKSEAPTGGANNKPMRTTGGLISFLSTAYSAGYTHCMRIWTTTPTEDEFITAVSKVWDFNAQGAGNERIVLAGNGFLTSLNRIARDSPSTRINNEGTLKVYGMELQKWALPQGTLYFRSHPLLSNHPRYAYSALVINPATIKYRPLTGRDTKMMDNIQAPDMDTHKGQWLTEAGFEWQHMPTMCYLGNFVK